MPYNGCASGREVTATWRQIATSMSSPTEDTSRSCPSIQMYFTYLITILSWSSLHRGLASPLQARSISARQSLSELYSADGDGGLVRDSYGLHTPSSSIAAHGLECGLTDSDTFILMYTHGCVLLDREW